MILNVEWYYWLMFAVMCAGMMYWVHKQIGDMSWLEIPLEEEE